MFRTVAGLHLERMDTALVVATATRGTSNRAFAFAVGEFVEALDRFTFFFKLSEVR